MTKIRIENTASFDVDAQKGFTPLCPDELPVAGGDEIVDALNKQATYAEYRVGSKDSHNRNAIWVATEEKPQFSPVEGKDVDIHWNAHCIMGEKGAELLAGLPDVTEYDYFVWKGMEPNMHPYGACYHDLNQQLSTGVIEYLKSVNVKTVIVGGLATDYCVRQTVLELAPHFDVVVNLEACRGIAEETVNDALEQFKNAKLGITVVNNIEEVEMVAV